MDAAPTDRRARARARLRARGRSDFRDALVQTGDQLRALQITQIRRHGVPHASTLGRGDRIAALVADVHGLAVAGALAQAALNRNALGVVDVESHAVTVELEAE